MGATDPIETRNAMRKVDSERYPFNDNDFLCYFEEEAYKNMLHPEETYFDRQESERALCFMDNGMRNGPGIYCWADGARYQGMFINDKLNGLGRFKNKLGTKFEGLFEDNMFVMQLESPIKILH